MAFQSYIDYMNCIKDGSNLSLYITGWCFHSSQKKCSYALYINNQPFSFIEKRNVRDDLNIVFSSGIQGDGNGFYIYATGLPATIHSVSLVASVDTQKEEIFRNKDIHVHPDGLDYSIDSIEKNGNHWDVTGWICGDNLKYSICTTTKDNIEYRYNLVERRDLVQFRIVEEKNAMCGVHFSFDCDASKVCIHVEGDNVSYDIPLENNKKKIFTKANAKKLFHKLRNISKKEESIPKVDTRYDMWFRKHQVNEEELEKQRQHVFSYNPKMSLIVATFNTPIEYLKKMMDTVVYQTYSNWELCIADGSSDDSVLSYIQENYRDSRIRIVKLDKNFGIAGNMNAAMEIATGDYIGLYDHDDELTHNALYEFVKAININPELEVIYSDEDKINSEGTLYFEPHFKSDFNIDYLQANNYICHLLFVKKSRIEQVGMLRSEYDGAQDYDFILRCTENLSDNRIYHIPMILYHWRIHQNSTAGNPASKMYAFDAGIRALSDHYKRMGIHANVYHGTSLGHYRTEFIFDTKPLVSIIHNGTIKSSYDKYEVVSNVNQAKGDYLVFLDDDCTTYTKDWLQALLGICMRKDVGIVGGRIYDEEDKVIHAGYILDSKGNIHSPFKGLPIGSSGYMGRLYSPQNVSAVSKKCMMISSSLFKQMNGFDASYAYDDVELCLRVQNQGYKVVYAPQCTVTLHKEEHRLNDYRCVLNTDPYYNVNFSLNELYTMDQGGE